MGWGTSLVIAFPVALTGMFAGTVVWFLTKNIVSVAVFSSVSMVVVGILCYRLFKRG
ncbi:MAG: hypothetical protein WCG28_04525 [bacterium]